MDAVLGVLQLPHCAILTSFDQFGCSDGSSRELVPARNRRPVEAGLYTCSHALHRYRVSTIAGVPFSAGIVFRPRNRYLSLPHSGQARLGFSSIDSPLSVPGRDFSNVAAPRQQQKKKEKNSSWRSL